MEGSSQWQTKQKEKLAGLLKHIIQWLGARVGAGAAWDVTAELCHGGHTSEIPGYKSVL